MKSIREEAALCNTKRKPKKAPDFIQIPYAVLQDRQISNAAKLVYGRLKLYFGNGRCNPKHETLAAEVCLGKSQLRAVLEELKQAGWIEWRRSRGSNFYTVHARKSAGKPAVRVPENRHSRVPENRQQKRSIEKKSLKRTAASQRITGDESQKTAIPAPDAVVVGEFAYGEEENRKADRPSAGRENISPEPPIPSEPIPGKAWGHARFDSIAAPASDAELQRLRAFLSAYFEGDEPPPNFAQSCVLRARGATVAQIIEFLQRLWAKKKNRPGGKNSPRKWNWFLEVIGEEFARSKRGPPEPVASPHPSNTASADEIESRAAKAVNA